MDRGALYFPPDPALYDAGVQPRVTRSARARRVRRDVHRGGRNAGMAFDAWTVFLHADWVRTSPRTASPSTPSATRTHRALPGEPRRARRTCARCRPTSRATAWRRSSPSRSTTTRWSTATTTSGTSSSSGRRRATCSASASASTASPAAAAGVDGAALRRGRAGRDPAGVRRSRRRRVSRRARARRRGLAGGELARVPRRASGAVATLAAEAAAPTAAEAMRFVVHGRLGRDQGLRRRAARRRARRRDRLASRGRPGRGRPGVPGGSRRSPTRPRPSGSRLDLEAYRLHRPAERSPPGCGPRSPTATPRTTSPRSSGSRGSSGSSGSTSTTTASLRSAPSTGSARRSTA